MILLNKLFGMVSGLVFFVRSFVRMPFEIFFSPLSPTPLSLSRFFLIQNESSFITLSRLASPFPSEITDRDCVYFYKIGTKSIWPLLGFSLLFSSAASSSSSFIFCLCVEIFCLCKISTSCFHCETSNFSLFWGKKDFELDLAASVRAGLVTKLELLFVFFLYIYKFSFMQFKAQSIHHVSATG